MTYGVGHRLGLDPALLWLWCRPVAAALIRSLAWELPYAVGATLKDQKNKTKKKGSLKCLQVQNYLESKHLSKYAEN